jgi:hypothetical protein
MNVSIAHRSVVVSASARSLLAVTRANMEGWDITDPALVCFFNFCTECQELSPAALRAPFEVGAWSEDEVRINVCDHCCACSEMYAPCGACINADALR